MSAESEPREGARDRFSSYRDLLESHGFHPSKKLGQNFLLDPTLHEIIAGAAAPTLDDLVLEIGPGLGFLTRALATRTRVVAVEIDSRLVAVLRREIPQFEGGDRVQLVHADALQSGRLAPELREAVAAARAPMGGSDAKVDRGRFLAVANLPYAVAGPLVMELALEPEPPEAMVLLIQLEMARRLAAQVGTREYGAMSGFLQLAYEVRFLRKVSNQAFRPRPRVESGIVHLVRRENSILSLPAPARRDLASFLRGLFQARRKKLRNAQILREQGDRGFGDPELDAALEARPDALDPDLLLRLWRASGGSDDTDGRKNA